MRSTSGWTKGSTWLCVGLLVLAAGCAADEAGEIARLKRELADLEAQVGPPPRSLDDLYPPNAKAPVYQIRMLEMGNPLTGVALEVKRGDLEQARVQFERFRERYREAAGLVPEWREAYPMEPVEKLEASLEAGVPDRIMAAMGQVGAVCHDCHVVNMPRVQQKYQWGDFTGVAVRDPATNETVGFGDLMWRLQASMTSIGMNLERGRAEEALHDLEAFGREFGMLAESCESCHAADRAYYVDASLQEALDRLETALQGASPDLERAGMLSRQIGMESCAACHRVHIPAAYAKRRWAAAEAAHEPARSTSGS